MQTNYQKYLLLARPGRLSLVMLLSAVAGCTNPPMAKTYDAPTVAVLVNHRWVEEDPRGFSWDVLKEEESTEITFAACVKQAAASSNLSVNVITGTQFRTIIFPDLDPRSAPRSMEALRLLMPDQRFQKRIKDGRIDYLAILGGETRTSETKGGIGCFGGYSAGACIGSLWWDHETHTSALVVDMRNGAEQLQEGGRAAGTSWFAMLAILPVAMPATNEAKGCKAFGHAVVQTLAKMLSNEE